MSDFGALAYLEYRQVVNHLRKAMRQPARAILYLLVLLYFAALMYFRVAGGSRALPIGGNGIGEPFASAIFFAAVILLGVILSAAASRVGGFTSLADARFLIGSRLNERNVIVWMQLRRSWRLLGRFLLAILIYALFFTHGGRFGGVTFALMGAVLIGVAVGIPMLQLRRRFGKIATNVVTTIVFLIGLLPLIAIGAGLLFGQAHFAASTAERLGGGIVVNRIFAGDWRPLLVEYGIFVLLVTLACAGSTDLYPELYAGSQLSIELMKRVGRRPFAVTSRYVARPMRAQGAHDGTVWTGAWVIFWKEWIGFRRSQRGVLLLILALAIAVIFGAGAGIFARTTHDPAGSIALVAGTGNFLLVFLAFGASVALAADIRKPIWWLNADSVQKRLWAWIAASSWRIAAIFAIGLLAWGIVAPMPWLAAAALPVAVFLVCILRSIGLALYAIFPSNFDQRGPIAMIRVLLTYLSFAPAAAIWVVTAIFAHSIVLGAILAFACGIVESLLLVEFAAYRIGRVGGAIAQSEAA